MSAGGRLIRSNIVRKNIKRFISEKFAGYSLDGSEVMYECLVEYDDGTTGTVYQFHDSMQIETLSDPRIPRFQTWRIETED